jgi:hypothetical protein
LSQEWRLPDATCRALPELLNIKPHAELPEDEKCGRQSGFGPVFREPALTPGRQTPAISCTGCLFGREIVLRVQVMLNE